ncbi:MAG: alpha/beta fold hydrolase [Candidatus Aenigmarchaeota archaeon]|nr:alpha/beta fold hydrolase [Candidatus Aenigmarchaeota archaeon]
MKEEEFNIENEGQEIVGILHRAKENNDKLVILVHGFTGDIDGPAGFWEPMAEKLCDNGFDVYRFNFRFTTKDWSLFRNMTITGEVSDLKKIISVMSKKYKIIGLIGSSLGGTISVLSYNDKVDAMVLWYPGIFLAESMRERFLTKQKLKELERKGYLLHKKYSCDVKVGRNFIYEMKDLDLIPFLKNIKCPTMLIHGDKDSRVPVEQSKRTVRFLNGPKKLEIIKGANHAWRDINYKLPVPEFQKKVMSLTVEWFKRWLK